MAPTGRPRGPAPSARCVLGHARLRVIDLETGDQPMQSEDGSVVVLLNGEIYNYRELRDHLRDRGHRFRTTSDTEIVVPGYREWGLEIGESPGRDVRVRRLGRGGTTTPSRTRPGGQEAAVHITRTSRSSRFRSELKGLLEVPDIDLGLNPSAMPLYLTYGYVPSPGTFYEKIEKLPPGSCLVLEGGLFPHLVVLGRHVRTKTRAVCRGEGRGQEPGVRPP